MKRIPYNTQEEWHAIRGKHIGGSEVASLFNAFEKPDGTTVYYHLFEDAPEDGEFIGAVSPYCSGVRLWHQKKGAIEPKPLDSPRVKAGQFFESGIADWARYLKPDWDICKVEDYIVHERIPGMGASLDYEITDHPLGHTAMDCKLVAADVWKHDWQSGEEPPLHIILQLQHQMACAGMDHGVVAVRVDGGDLHLVDVPRNEAIITKCEEAVSAFWHAIKAGREPDIKYDVTVARDLYHTSDKEVVLDCTDASLASNNELMQRVDAWAFDKTQENLYGKGADAKANDMLAILKDADKALLPDGRVLWAKTITVKRKAAPASTSTHRRLTVKEAENV